jgi:hypothetical protein
MKRSQDGDYVPVELAFNLECENARLRETCEQHRAYAHMMQEQRSQIADYCRTLEKQIAELLAANAELIDVRAEQSAIAGELAELRSEARTADGIKWSEISEMWRHKFEAAERELSDLQTKSAREVFARGVYLGPRGTGSMPKQFAPEWWYNCFNKGYHDMSIFEIEWGYDAYLKYQKTKQ